MIPPAGSAAPDALAEALREVWQVADWIVEARRREAKLRHDIERHIEIAADLATKETKLWEALGVAMDGLQRLATPTKFEPADMPHMEFVTRRVFAEKTLETARTLAGGSDGK